LQLDCVLLAIVTGIVQRIYDVWCVLVLLYKVQHGIMSLQHWLSFVYYANFVLCCCVICRFLSHTRTV